MPKLNVLMARSFWIAAFTALANVLFLATGEVPFVAEEAADKVILAIDGIAAVWIYIERVTGSMKLVKPWDQE